MNQLILASHGDFARGARDTISMVLGESAMPVHVVSLLRDDTESIRDRVSALLQSFSPDDTVYICTDMLGSSVNNEMLELMQTDGRVKVISGMNIPLILTLATAQQPLLDAELAQLITDARLGICDCSATLSQQKAATTVKLETTQKQKGVQANKGPANISLVRLDYRLLHGQVVFSWMNTVGAERIIVVDNAAAQDEVRVSALKLAKPAGVRLNIFTVERAISKMDKLNTLGENVMMIFGNVRELRTFCESYRIDVINFGAAANHEGATPVGGRDTSVFLDAAEKADAQALLDMGISIYEQQTPTQAKTSILAF
ncbi:PTS sugar transporter subunit IIB [Collinsella sp. zg1085]|uniref:PTS mannose/fructose/sorbose transporter subunit IIAB n=1 Tax=Collinsella sp. zg1085 TaxID=2844380 RepID=UPI001C0D2CD2|nr:PTS mannose/fructose/sorbose transporter subunit IIAB [Collinsella sp. zg1085]QWT17810.1 PTS sugar transporter subunit IIB [Collinsella sp. zg1085]